MASDLRHSNREKIVAYIIGPHALVGMYLADRLNSFRTVVAKPHLIESALLRSSPAPSVAVVDRDIPIGLGATIRLLRHELPQVRILVLAESFTAGQMCRLLASGCHGFLRYDGIGDLTTALGALLSGHTWVPPEVLEEFALNAPSLLAGRRNSDTAFTEREALVVELVEKRLTNKEVALALGITERTVRFHLRNIFEKLGVSDRYSVVEFVRGRNGDGNGALRAQPSEGH
jgi:DNA-binding NarL/FixJ family response regulator